MGTLTALMMATGGSDPSQWTVDMGVYQRYSMTDAGVTLRVWRPECKSGVAQLRRWLHYCRILTASTEGFTRGAFNLPTRFGLAAA